MGLDLSLYTVLQIARIALPTATEAVIGRVTRGKCDERIASFADRVIHRARVRLDVVGNEQIPRDRAFIYMSNHQSHMDIPVLFATAPARTLRMVAKTELFRVPIFGAAMKAAGFIEVDRSDRAQAIASLKRAAALIADGVSVWIAPEGSRSRSGSLGPLKKGGFHLAIETGTPIVPVAISGTYEILPPKSTRMAYDVPVRVVYGAPISVEGRTVEELVEEVAAFFADNVSTSPPARV